MSIANSFMGEVNVMTPPIKTLLIYPDKDAFILESEEFVNYGESVLMQVTKSDNSGIASIMNFGGLSKVDPKVWANLIDINLQYSISGYRTVSHTINVSEYNDSDWSESFVSWGNAPAKGNQLFQMPVGAKDTSVTKDVTSLVKARKANDSIGFYFDSDDAPANRILSIFSRESSNKPALVLRYYDIPGAPYQKTLNGSLDVISKVLCKDGPFGAELTGTFDIKPIYEYIDLNGSMYVPKFVAVHETFTNDAGAVTGENKTDTEVKDVYTPTDSDHGDWGTELTGTVSVKHAGPIAILNGTVTPWKGSAFQMTFKASDTIVYQGDEIADILAAEKNVTVNNTASGGDLLTGSVTTEGCVRAELNGTLSVSNPTSHEIGGSFIVSKSVFDVTTSAGGTSSTGDLLTCSNTIVYKEDGTIDENKSCYLKVDGHVGGVGDGHDQITGTVTVSKFFATNTTFYKDSAVVFTEAKDSDATNAANVYDATKNPSDSVDASVQISCPKAAIVFTKNGDGSDNTVSVDAAKTGAYTYIIGKVKAELTGNMTVDIPTNIDSGIDGTAKIAAMVFPTTASGSTVTCGGDLLTGSITIQPPITATLTGSVSVGNQIDDAEMTGNVLVVNETENIPELTGTISIAPPFTKYLTGALNVAVPFKTVLDGSFIVVNEVKDIPELNGSSDILALVYPITKDKDGHTTSGGDLLTCLNDKIVYEKEKDGSDSIYIDDSQSNAYFRVMAMGGIITGVKADGTKVPDPDLYDYNIVETLFDKPNQELIGDTYIAAKKTVWLNGIVTVVNVAGAEMTGSVTVRHDLEAEITGTVTVNGGIPPVEITGTTNVLGVKEAEINGSILVKAINTGTEITGSVTVVETDDSYAFII